MTTCETALPGIFVVVETGEFYPVASPKQAACLRVSSRSEPAGRRLSWRGETL